MRDMIFQGVRILDFTQVIAGAYGTSILADMGAEVIKVEPPVCGDSLRLSPPLFGNESSFFLQHNRNKKSISIDLKKAEGIAIIKELIPHCKVIYHNFKPGVMEKLGLGYKDVCAIKEDIIYVAVSGFGQNNRYSDLPAYDIIIQSETGIAAQNGVEEGAPLRCPLSIADYVSALYSATAASSALYHHAMTGKGQYIDVAMYDSLISIMDNSFLIYDAYSKSGIKEKEKKDTLKKIGLVNSGNRHPGIAPHGFYRTRDGYIAHASLSNEMWHKLLKVIEREDLIGNALYEKLDSRRIHWKEIDQIIENWSQEKTTKEVISIFRANRLPCGKCRTIDEVYDDPQSKERGIFHEYNHKTYGKIRLTNNPIKFSETPAEIRSHAPRLGQHNSEILSELLSYSEEYITILTKNCVLYSA